jgi:hypothetical protein
MLDAADDAHSEGGGTQVGRSAGGARDYLLTLFGFDR